MTGSNHLSLLRRQLLDIEPGVGVARCYPCSAETAGGKVYDCVYFVAREDLGAAGIQPGGRHWLREEDVQAIRPSPMRLPREFAERIYQAGEAGMGYWSFTVVFSWWRRRHYVQGFLDFIEYPAGTGPPSVKSVLPRSATPIHRASASKLDVYWCALDLPVVEELTIPAGAGVYIGAPASPLPISVQAALSQAVGGLPGILEAHLPQCWAPSAMPSAAQVLVAVVDKTRPDSAETEAAVKEAVGRICPPGRPLDVWLVGPDHFFLASIRKAGCRIK